MTPTKESILAKHLSVDHALDSGLHFTRDLVYAAMEEYGRQVAGEAWKNPCEDLPEPYSQVLAVIQTLHDRWIEIIGFEKNHFYLPGRGRTLNVAFWMPLPPMPSDTSTLKSTKNE